MAVNWTGQTKTVDALTESTSPADTDCMMIATDATIKKIKWSAIVNLIKVKLGIGTAADLTTTSKEIVGAINEINSASTTERIAPFTANSNFTTHNTLVFFNPLTRMVFFSLDGAFINGARNLGNVKDPYRPKEESILMASNGGAVINTDGYIILDKNEVTTGDMFVTGFWRIAE